MDLILILLAGVVVAVALTAGAFLILKMRRAGLAIHHQIAGLREEIQTTRNDILALRAETQHQASRDDENLSRIRDLVLTIADASSQIHDSVRSTDAGLRGLANQMSELAAVARDSVDLLARKPPQGLPVDSSFLETKTDAELLPLAESIAVLRPLVPYPRWQTDADLQNPDLAFQLRRWIWQFFADRRQDSPVVVPWHAGTRLRLFLGGDLARQIYIAGCFEPNEFAFLDRILQPGMTFVDAGANDGLYSVFAARRVGSAGTVWAFEPSRREAERLQYNLDLNGLKARVFPLALADTPGQAELAIGGFQHAGHNTLGALRDFAEPTRKETVEIRRLDDIVEQDPPARIDVLKLDVEGAEFRLLRGALNTLHRYRPVVLFELSEESLRQQGSTRDQVLDLLRSATYAIYTFERNTGLPVPAAAGVFSDNMIALPKEKEIPDSIHWPWPR